MPRRQPGETKRVTIGFPKAVHSDLVEVAGAKGLDLAALINVIVTDVRPALMKWLRDHRAALGESRAEKES